MKILQKLVAGLSLRFRPCNAKLLYRVDKTGVWLPVKDLTACNLSERYAEPLHISFTMCHGRGVGCHLCPRFEAMRQLMRSEAAKKDALAQRAGADHLKASANDGDGHGSHIGNDHFKGESNVGVKDAAGNDFKAHPVLIPSVPGVEKSKAGSNQAKDESKNCKHPSRVMLATGISSAKVASIK